MAQDAKPQKKGGWDWRIGASGRMSGRRKAALVLKRSTTMCWSAEQYQREVELALSMARIADPAWKPRRLPRSAADLTNPHFVKALQELVESHLAPAGPAPRPADEPDRQMRLPFDRPLAASPPLLALILPWMMPGPVVAIPPHAI